MENIIRNACTNCGSIKFKNWEKLTDEEKFVVEKLSDASIDQREKQRFCSGCLYVLKDNRAMDI